MLVVMLACRSMQLAKAGGCEDDDPTCCDENEDGLAAEGLAAGGWSFSTCSHSCTALEFGVTAPINNAAIMEKKLCGYCCGCDADPKCAECEPLTTFEEIGGSGRDAVGRFLQIADSHHSVDRHLCGTCMDAETCAEAVKVALNAWWPPTADDVVAQWQARMAGTDCTITDPVEPEEGAEVEACEPLTTYEETAAAAVKAKQRLKDQSPVMNLYYAIEAGCDQMTKDTEACAEAVSDGIKQVDTGMIALMEARVAGTDCTITENFDYMCEWCLPLAQYSTRKYVPPCDEESEEEEEPEPEPETSDEGTTEAAGLGPDTIYNYTLDLNNSSTTTTITSSASAVLATMATGFVLL
jgi:hypothetical protein